MPCIVLFDCNFVLPSAQNLSESHIGDGLLANEVWFVVFLNKSVSLSLYATMGGRGKDLLEVGVLRHHPPVFLQDGREGLKMMIEMEKKILNYVVKSMVRVHLINIYFLN